MLVSELDVGAAYVTDTSSPLGTDDASVKTTVEPLMEEFVTVTASLPTNTVNVLLGGPTEPNVSLNVNVTVEPEYETLLRVGRVTSGPAVEKLVTAAFTSEIESLPEASCTAEFAAVASLVGAVYDTVTVFPN